MSRIREVSRAELDEAGRRLYDEILGARGSMAGPFGIWLHSPEFTRRATRLGKYLRYQTILPPNLSELVILITSRLTRCPVEWAIHEPLARRGGLADEIIQALSEDRRPSFSDPASEAIYHYCVQLHQDHTVDESSLRGLVQALGSRAAVEITGLCGYYTMVSMTLNAFAIGVGDNGA
jgi:4-carboxymuconolactone decarboxylase